MVFNNKTYAVVAIAIGGQVLSYFSNGLQGRGRIKFNMKRVYIMGYVTHTIIVER